MPSELQTALELIQKEFQELKSVLSSGDLAKYSKDFNELGDAIRQAGREAISYSSAFVNLKEKILQTGSASALLNSDLKSMSSTITTSAKDIINNFGGIAAEIAGVGLAAKGIITVPNAFKEIGSSAHNASFQISDFNSQMASLSKLLPESVENAIKGVGNVLEIGQSARNFENAILEAVAAGGNMGDMLNVIGNNLEGMDGQMSQWVMQQQKIADATGMSTSQVLSLSHQLAKVPEALRDGVTVGKDATRAYSDLEAIIRTAHGSFQDVGDVIKDVTFSINTLGSSTQQALEFTARMAAVSQSLKMPLDLVRDFTHRAAEGFKFLGDNTQGAISIMANMGPALREGGLGPAAVQEIVSGFTKGVTDMDIAQKAFVSAQTGGAGGLQGAFEIELALREGNLEEVANRVQNTLEGMIGGPLVTLEEAATSQAAAAQMTKQIQFLTTGPLKVAQNEQQAIALVEAMARQQRGEFGELGTSSPTEALEKAIGRGASREERQIDLLQLMSNEAQAQTMYLSQIVDQRRMQFLGVQGPAGEIIRNEIDRQSVGATMVTAMGGPVGALPQNDTRGEAAMGITRGVNIAKRVVSVVPTMIDEITAPVPTTEQIAADREARMTNKAAMPQPANNVATTFVAGTEQTKTQPGQQPAGADLRTITIRITNDKNEVISLIDAQIDAKTGKIVKQAVRAVNKQINDNMQGG